MAFLDDLSEIISEKGKEAKEKAKKVAEIANLKGKISGFETEIRKNYRKIGEAYYEAHRDSEISCEFEEYVQSIRDAKKAVAELTYKLNELKGAIECKGCGRQIRSGHAFCPNCGTKVEVEYYDEEETDVPEEVVEYTEVILDEVEELEEVLEDIEE